MMKIKLEGKSCHFFKGQVMKVLKPKPDKLDVNVLTYFES